MSSNGLSVVYVSYDGMHEPLGQSQVLPYLRRLAALGHSFELISFEKPPHPLHFRKVIHPGIRWTALRYHKRPTVPATLFDMAQGATVSGLQALLARADLVHVRSYVPATLSVPLILLGRRPLLFDMRGLWPDERVEDGNWSPTSGVYRGAKWVERNLVHVASAITVLTNSMARYLRHEAPFRARIRAPIHVIPTCTDLERFSPEVAPNSEVAALTAGHRTLTYVGSFGGRYLAEEMARFYLAWRRYAAPARFLVVSRQDPEQIRSVLASQNVAHELIHRSATNTEVPALLRCAEAGVFFHPERFANRGAAPTKAGEMLAAGLSVAGNCIGDVPEVIGDLGGVVLRQFDSDSLDTAAQRLAVLASHPDRTSRSRTIAQRWFSLERGANAYHELYRGLASRHGLDLDHAWPRV